MDQASPNSAATIPMTPVRYRLSGKLGKSPLVLLAAAILMFAVPSYLYGMVNMHIPYMKLKILITALLGAGLGGATMWMAWKLHCRSLIFVAFVALIGSAAGVYVGVAAYMESLLATGGVKTPALSVSA